MKWSKAIWEIRNRMASGEKVLITYHRKHMKNDSHIEYVDEVIEYLYNRETCFAINTDCNQFDESTHIVDEIN